MRFLFLFLDGVGLGNDDPEVNPLAKAEMPHLQELLDGKRLLAASAPLITKRATLTAIDACLGIPGLPQSATGQATLITGMNVPQQIGRHYGPKPNREIRQLLEQGSLFSQLLQRGYTAALLNAYPESYFDAIKSGKRLYSAIPQAVVNAGIALKTRSDLYQRQALSADFTGLGWRTRLKYNDAPVISEQQAGELLAELALSYDFTFFEYWPSDYAGHRQDEAEALRLLEAFDQVLGGLLAAWDDQQGLVLLTSDHGNMEDLSTRRHTDNPVPALLIGSPELRSRFTADLHSLVDIAPAILQFFPRRLPCVSPN